MAAIRWGLPSIRVVCLREEKLGRFSAERSLTLAVDLSGAAAKFGAEAPWRPVVGWEHNAKGQLGPRVVNLSSTLDPKQRAEAAVDLNLKLMRWRALPSLKMGPGTIAESRVLLLGAGTLGCAVARTLQGWGCRRFTLVDAGKVAFSNPVRQSLFEFEDCLGGGRPKAEAAAAMLRRIHPGCEAQGIELTIPMPGHAVGESAGPRATAALEASARLDALVQEHDVTFLLMDTRESRWLPTVQCAAHGKLAISVALGFDSFLVMRHGVPQPSPPEEEEGKEGKGGNPSRLGCYFCNDVAAPLDSTANRTLDQQCTVVRPGLAPIASGLAVELLASLTQHPRGAHAPAPQQAEASISGGGGAEGEEGQRSVLGDVPHSIRGFLDAFSQLSICCPHFPSCVACSDKVLASYTQIGSGNWNGGEDRGDVGKGGEEGEEGEKGEGGGRGGGAMAGASREAFLLRVFNDPMYLEQVTGLDEMKRATEDAMRMAEEAQAMEGGSDGDDDEFCLL